MEAEELPNQRSHPIVVWMRHNPTIDHWETTPVVVSVNEQQEQATSDRDIGGWGIE